MWWRVREDRSVQADDGSSEASSSDFARWLLRSVPDGLWVLDRDGRTVFANESMAMILGREPGEMIGFDAFSALDGAGQEQLRQHLRDLETVGEPGEDLECLLLRRDGERIWTLISHSPILDDHGTHRGWLHRVTEYTQQRQLLETLQRREHQLAEAQTIAKIGSWEWDVAADVVRWSDQLFRIYDLDSDKFVPTFAGFLEGIHPLDREAVGQTVGAVLTEGDSFEFDARILRPDGGIGWVRGRGIVTRDEHGVPLRMSGTAQDVTAAKQAEQALALLRAVATAANDADTLAEAVPAAIEEVTRYTPWRPQAAYLIDGTGELAELSLGGVRPAAGEAQAVHELALAAMANGEMTTRHLPDALLLGAPLVAAGRVAGALVLRREGTALPEERETATVAQAMALFARVAEREHASEVLAAARDEAMSASRAKSEFLATMSHEIRTPLNGVIGLSELLGRTELTDRQRRLADGIEEAGRALLGLVNDVLDLSKIEAGRLDLEEVEFDPRLVIEQSASLLAGAARAKSLEFAIACSAELPPLVRGDPGRLGQVLANLTANAVKFTSSGEVVVRASVQPDEAGEAGDRVASDHAAESVRLRIEVSDTGLGIAVQDQARLFDAFAQADSSTTRQYGGTGLGLAISSRLVSAMGGEIGVRSEPGVGSTFWFTALLGAPDEAASAGVVPPTSLRDVRILVVDDNDTNRMILAEQVAVWGAHSEVAASAAEGLTLLERAHDRGAPFDIVLLDYLMPEVDGLEFARRARVDANHAHTRLVLLTSAIEPDQQVLAEAGVDLALAKPVLSGHLRDAVSAVLTGTVSRWSEAERATEAVEHGERDERGLGSAAVGGGSRPLGRVLLVEDHPVNQLVAEGILASLGYEVVVAGNGEQGVQRFAEVGDSLDAVLMDCQMPVLDGYAATRAIRAMEGPSRRLPIIALTAAAVTGERERCLEAGMDDFLTKPVDVGQLRGALQRWVSRAPGEPLVDTNAHPSTQLPLRAPTVDPELLDADRLGELLDLDPGDPSMLLRFIGRFGASSRRTALEMAGQQSAGAAYEVGRLAHALKGSAANLGAHRLAARCYEVELLGEELVLASEDLIGSVAHEVEAATSALEAFAQGLRAAST
jgi:hypothetical protein